jgi:UDP-glucose 4-epimerase
LLTQGHTVAVLDDFSTGKKENIEGLTLELYEGSILDPAVLTAATAHAGSIVHLAARPSVPRSLEDPVAAHEVNATGTVRVLEAARAVDAHVVVASSSSVYGASEVLPKTESLPSRPMSPYAASKLATESYALSWAHSFGTPVLAFRFFNVYGPLQAANHAYAAVVPAFIDAALADRPVTVYGDGEQSRDFTYVGTVSDILERAAVNRVTSLEPVNLAFGTRTTLLDLIRLLEGIVSQPITREHVETRKGDVRHSQAANDSLRGLFPDCKPVPLSDGLAQTIEWFRTGQVPNQWISS